MAGQPVPVKTVVGTSETSIAESTSKSNEPEYALARLCELLSPEEAQSLGGPAEGKAGNSPIDGHAVCIWSDKTTMTIGFQTGTSTARAETGPSITNTPTTVDGLPAVKSLDTDTVVTCEMLVDLPSWKMVHTTVGVLSAGEGKYDQCRVATELANLIIPRVKDQ